MFSATLDSTRNERSRRGLSTVTSLAAQMLAIGILILLPLLRPTGLPLFHRLTAPVSLGRPGDTSQPRVRSGTTMTPFNPGAITLRPSSTRFWRPEPATGDDAPQISAYGGGIPGSIGPGSFDGLLNSFGDRAPAVMPKQPSAAAAPLRISHMSEGDLIRKVLPIYPPLARNARIQGSVVLQATISKNGAIKNLRVVSGHPMLVQAAIDAVRQWRYRPYLLNHEPVEVETQVTVNFSLAGE